MLEHVSMKVDAVKSNKKWYHFISFNLRILLGIVALFWVLELIDLIPFVNLDLYGIRPRQVIGLIGIPLMPFLHADIQHHLVSNTLPFLILGFIVLQAEKKKFIFATIVITLLSGLGVWIFGSSNSNHIGASGLIYGYFGYVMTRAIMERKIIWIITGIAVAAVYGSLILGVFTLEHDISWTGHFFGLVAGSWFGWKRTQRVRKLEENPEDDADKIVKQISDATKKIEADVDDVQGRMDKIQQEIKENKPLIAKKEKKALIDDDELLDETDEPLITKKSNDKIQLNPKETKSDHNKPETDTKETKSESEIIKKQPDIEEPIDDKVDQYANETKRDVKQVLKEIKRAKQKSGDDKDNDSDEIPF